MEDFELENQEMKEEVLHEEEVQTPDQECAEEPIYEENVTETEPEAEEEVPHLNFVLTPEEEIAPPAPVKKRPKWGRIALVSVLALILVLQVACIAMFTRGSVGIAGSTINSKGELIIYYTNGTSQNLGVVVGKSGTNGTTTIVDGSVDNTLAINQALRSSVSIICTFAQESRFGAISNYYSAGSGVIYQLDMENGDAFIITNYHVVYDENSRAANGIAEKIDVYLYGGEFSGLQMEATYVGGSMYYDLAVLRIEKNELLKHSEALAANVANSDDVQVGTAAIAIGNAEGEGISVTSGVVSVDSEYLTMTGVDGMTSVQYRVMRIDTAVNQGNSGGGLFDRNGRLIGIVNAKIIDASVENIGYALPSSVVTAVVDNIIDYCYETENENVMRPIMGITVQNTHSKAVYEEETGLLRVVETVVVQSVDKNLLGKVFEVDDQLIAISINGNTKTITRQFQLIDTMVTARPGDVVEFTVLRDGVEQVLTITVTEDCLTAY